jgi:UDP-glucose 4-epimerase
MRVLITGAFGYLGGRLTEGLALNKKFSLKLGSRSNSHLLNQVGSEVVQTIWKSSSDLEKICENVDAIVHLAGMNAEDCNNHPASALDVNGVNTAKLLSAAINKNVKRFIYISTAHVYSSPLAGVVSEEDGLSNLHPYATSHRAGEDVVRLAHKKNKIEGIVIRLSNTFGAPVNQHVNCWMLLVNDICKQVVNDNKIVLQSDGRQQINFITMTDACNAIEHLLLLSTSKLADGLFNVGGKMMSVLEMALLVQARSFDIFQYQPEISYLDRRENTSNTNFEFSSKKIISTGLSLTGNYNSEVEGTLLACKSFYGAKN